MAEKKPEESFRVIDRRPFTTQGELREEFVAEQQREAQQETKKAAEAPQPPEAARELIDMLDAMHEKTKGNLAPEEDSLLLDLLGKLKMTYLEVNQALAAQAAQAATKAKGR